MNLKPHMTNPMRSRRALSGLVLLPALVALFLLSTSHGASVSQAKESPAAPPQDEVYAAATTPTPVFECFNVQASSTAAAPQPGVDPKAYVRLVTQNFGGKLVRVRQITAMCESAIKYAPPTAGTNDQTPPPDIASAQVFACYNLERGNNPNDPYSLTTNNFGKDVVIVRASQLMCEEATKTRVDSAGVSTTIGKLAGDIWQCFNLNQGKNAAAAFRVVTNNFGRDDVRVINANQMCETASKTRLVPGIAAPPTMGQPSGVVYECFRVESGVDPKAQVTLTTRNFGAVNVVVRRAISMCEHAVKRPILTLPTPSGDGSPIGED